MKALNARRCLETLFVTVISTCSIAFAGGANGGGGDLSPTKIANESDLNFVVRELPAITLYVLNGIMDSFAIDNGMPPSRHRQNLTEELLPDLYKNGDLRRFINTPYYLEPYKPCFYSNYKNNPKVPHDASVSEGQICFSSQRVLEKRPNIETLVIKLVALHIHELSHLNGIEIEDDAKHIQSEVEEYLLTVGTWHYNGEGSGYGVRLSIPKFEVSAINGFLKHPMDPSMWDNFDRKFISFEQLLENLNNVDYPREYKCSQLARSFEVLREFANNEFGIFSAFTPFSKDMKYKLVRALAYYKNATLVCSDPLSDDIKSIFWPKENSASLIQFLHETYASNGLVSIFININGSIPAGREAIDRYYERTDLTRLQPRDFSAAAKEILKARALLQDLSVDMSKMPRPF